MAASKAKGFEYNTETQTKVSLGGRFLTVTEIKIKGEEEEYPKGGLEIEPLKLGLPDGLVEAIWTTPLLEAKASEFQKGGFKAYPAQINTFTSKNPVLTLLQAGKEKEFGLELEEANGKALKGYTATVWAIGR